MPPDGRRGAPGDHRERRPAEPGSATPPGSQVTRTQVTRAAEALRLPEAPSADPAAPPEAREGPGFLRFPDRRGSRGCQLLGLDETGLNTLIVSILSRSHDPAIPRDPEQQSGEAQEKQLAAAGRAARRGATPAQSASGQLVGPICSDRCRSIGPN